MTIKELAGKLAKAEGLKSQVAVGDIRELLGLISDAIFSDEELSKVLFKNGQRRAKRKK